MHIRFPEFARRATMVLALAGICRTVGAQTDTLRPQPRDSARSVGVLRSGDVVKLAVYQNKELSGEYIIDPQGQLQVPGLGVIQASGQTPTQLREALRAGLQRRGIEEPEIAVQPLVRVSVLGEVRAPALYPVDPGISLIQLLTVAGGPTPNANLSHTRVVREGHVFEVDLQSALAGSAAGRVVLYSNDVVVVPKRTGFTRENLSLLVSLATVGLSIATFVVTNQLRNRQ